MVSKYRRCEDVVARRIAGETLLVPIYRDLANMEGVFFLDGDVARFVWDKLENPMSLDELCAQVASCFDSPPDTMPEDVHIFVAELLQAGLIVEEP